MTDASSAPPARFAAGLEPVILHSQGCKLLGGFYTAAGEGPRPSCLLLHGVPGIEKNLDLAYALRDAGWNCLYFHYRGCWGSGGDYSFNGLAQDVRAATDWLLAHPAVDPRRLAVVGSSMGGYAALAAFASDERLKAAVAICPLADPPRAPLSLQHAQGFAEMLQGAGAERLQAEWNALRPLHELAPRLASRPVLLISGDLDNLFPPGHYGPLLKALPGLPWRRLAGGDHSLSACRPALVEAVLSWLPGALP